MTPDHQSIDAMVSAYLARGGRIRRLPDAVPATNIDVLRYLKTRKVDVERAPPKNANPEAKYLHAGAIITSEGLVKLANAHRRRQGLAPFELI